MDDIDIKIIHLLEENGRMSHEELSKHLHISRPAVHQRIGKLEQNGVIQGYRGIVDWRKLEQKIKALIMVKLRCQIFREVADAIISMEVPGVTMLECQRLAGEYCLMVKIRVASPEDVERYIDHLVKIPEVQETTTTFILSSVFENGTRMI